MDSLKDIKVGLKCSVIIVIHDIAVRRNGVVKNKIEHLQSVWCVELSNPLQGEPFYTKAFEKFFEILEPMTEHERLINALDELNC